MRPECQESFPDEAGKRKLILSEGLGNGAPFECGKTLRVPFMWIRACQRISLVAAMVLKTLSRFKREGVISFEMPLRKKSSSRLDRRTSWFFSSCGRFLSSYYRDLTDPLVWPMEKPVSMRVARGLWRFLSSRCRVPSPHLEPRLELEVSSPVLTWILGFLWSLHKGVRLCLEWRRAHPLSLRTVAAVSGFPSM